MERLSGVVLRHLSYLSNMGKRSMYSFAVESLNVSSSFVDLNMEFIFVRIAILIFLPVYTLTLIKVHTPWSRNKENDLIAFHPLLYPPNTYWQALHTGIEHYWQLFSRERISTDRASSTGESHATTVCPERTDPAGGVTDNKRIIISITVVLSSRQSRNV